MADLLTRAGVEIGRVFVIAHPTVTLGRSPRNEVVIGDASASRRHAEINLRDTRHFIRDLASTHGTLVNGERVETERRLEDGDVIRIGATELLYRLRGPSDSSREVIAPKAAGTNETISFALPALDGPAPSGLSERHTDALTALTTALEAVLDLDEVLNILMDLVFETFSPDRAVILLRPEAGGELAPAIWRPAGAPVAISQTVIDQAIEQRMALLIADTAEDSRFSAAESVVAMTIRSAICSPLVRRGRVLGALYLDSQIRPFRYGKEDLALLNLLAASVSMAIENALLVREKIEAERLAAIGLAIAGVSHYIKNVLGGVVGASSIIERGLRNDDYPLVRNAWAILKRSNDKMTRFVQDMLSYSRRREPNWEPGAIGRLVAEIAEEQMERAAREGVALTCESAAPLPGAWFDPASLHDAILNLVSNAIDACAGREGARVEIRCDFDEAGDSFQITIADNGPGVPEEARAKIFQPFFSTKGAKGTGLGLAVAKKNIEEHGGRLTLESPAEGGALFRIALPRQSPEHIESDHSTDHFGDAE